MKLKAIIINLVCPKKEMKCVRALLSHLVTVKYFYFCVCVYPILFFVFYFTFQRAQSVTSQTKIDTGNRKKNEQPGGIN